MKLNQVIAVEKGVKSRVYSETSEQDKLCQKPELFNGFSKVYKPLDEESGEMFPPDNKKVQFKVADILKSQRKLLTESLDITAAKDFGNLVAVADVKVGDEVILKDVPVTYLLHLEKQLTDLHTAVGRLPVLDSNSEWTKDNESGLYKTPVTQTHRVKTTKVPIVLYEATEKHPAQTQLIDDTILTGYWHKTDHSGAIALTERTQMLEKIEALMKAVKFAREQANMVDAPSPDIGSKIFDYIGF